MSEWSAVQAPMLKYAAEIGWQFVPTDEAMRRRGSAGPSGVSEGRSEPALGGKKRFIAGVPVATREVALPRKSHKARYGASSYHGSRGIVTAEGEHTGIIQTAISKNIFHGLKGLSKAGRKRTFAMLDKLQEGTTSAGLR